MSFEFPPKLSQPALRALHGAGIETLKDLVGRSEAEIKALHGMGPNAMQKLRDAMTAAGLAFSETPK